MATVEAEVTVTATRAEAWDYFFAQMTWPGWVDGFDHVIEQDGYPEVGGRLTWTTTAAGRGDVTEVVITHEPRNLHIVEFTDSYMEGTLRTGFTGAGAEASTVHQQLSYELSKGGPFSRLTDLFFIRSQLRGSLQRSLTAFGFECEDFARAATAAVDKLIS